MTMSHCPLLTYPPSETMKRVLAFPPETKLEWKSHDASIQQRTAIEESRREKASNHHNHGDNKRGIKHQQQAGDGQKSAMNS